MFDFRNHGDVITIGGCENFACMVVFPEKAKKEVVAPQIPVDYNNVRKMNHVQDRIRHSIF